MKPAKLVIAGALLVALVGFAVWRHRVADHAEAAAAHLAVASTAITELTAQETAFPAAFRSATAELTTALSDDPKRAATILHATIEPMFDRYIATLDRAVAASDLVAADSADAGLATHIDTIRRRGKALTAARGKLADLEKRVAGDATIDEIANALLAIGTELAIAP